MDRSPLWLPYTQMQTVPPPLRIERAEGARLVTADGREFVDAISSWWSVLHGYNHPVLNRALEEQLGRVAHVMLGGLETAPAAELARELVAVTPEGLEHVFFSDSGSVGVEVALKMAVQFWLNEGERGKTRFLALEGAYHGDTTGAMAVCDPEEGMHSLFAGLLPEHRFVPIPAGGLEAGESALAPALERLEATLAAHAHELAGFIVEPLLQGAGGFRIYAPAYLREARRLCDHYNVLLIFDEVATGFGRTGTLFAAERAGVTPEIMVLGKGLTGGYLGHAATLATGRIYEAFLGADAERCLMHGPTFMGNALACAVAKASVGLCRETGFLERIGRIEAILREELLGFKADGVRETRVLGAVGVIEAETPGRLVTAQKTALARGVWLRPFGTTLYTAPPSCIEEEELRRVTAAMKAAFD
jgi:adenosylmethionine---8-amino-7-oxononanoate aminotransferase